MATSAIRAMAAKDLKVAWRSPLFVIISILVPIAFTLLYAVVIHVSTTGTIAVSDQDNSARSHQFIQIMNEVRNDDGPYYEILTTDPAEAERMYASGQAGAVLTIPEGFGDAVDAGGPSHVRLRLVNINADGTKNQHLRLEHTMRLFNQAAYPSNSAALQITEDGQLDHDIPITIYLGSALIVFAALYSGIVNSGVAIAREWEDRTAKSLVLSPSGPVSLITGKWIACFLTSLATTGGAVMGVGAILGFPITALGPQAFVVLFTVWFYGLGIGTLLGVALRKSLPLIPIAVIITVGHFLVSGYESYIRGFAHGGIVEPLWQATNWIPIGPLFDAVRFEASGLGYPAGYGFGLLATTAAALVLTAFAASRLARTGTFTQGQ